MMHKTTAAHINRMCSCSGSIRYSAGGDLHGYCRYPNRYSISSPDSFLQSFSVFLRRSRSFPAIVLRSPAQVTLVSRDRFLFSCSGPVHFPQSFSVLLLRSRSFPAIVFCSPAQIRFSHAFFPKDSTTSMERLFPVRYFSISSGPQEFEPMPAISPSMHRIVLSSS